MNRVLVFAIAFVTTAFAPAIAGVRVLVPSHDIARGAVVTVSDFTYSAANVVMAGVATSASDVVGMETRRALRTGETVRLQDFRHPVLVAKGATVTMVFEAPGIVLTASGRAITEGGLGDTVTIQNPVSFRQISGVVTGPGQVRTEMSGARLLASAQN